MLSIFKSTVTPTARRVIVPKFQYVNDKMQESLARAQDYYAFTSKSVKSSHLLVRLINSVTTSMSLPMEEYLWHIADDAPMLARALGIGTYVQPAKVLPDTTFYGPKCYELIQLRNGYLTYGQDWRTVRPVRVKVHPRTDLSFVPLDGREVHDESGLAIITIDLEALMYMYRQWYTDERLRQSEALTVKQFIATRVLPGMLESHLDVAWFNRLSARVNSYPVDPEVGISGLALPPLGTYADQTVDEYYDRFVKGNFRLTDLMVNYPMFYNTSLYELTRLTSAPPTVSNNVYELLVCNHYLKTLMEIDLRAPGDANSDTRSKLTRQLRRARNERWLTYVGLPESTTAILNSYTR